jgi:hypothetical protein
LFWPFFKISKFILIASFHLLSFLFMHDVFFLYSSYILLFILFNALILKTKIHSRKYSSRPQLLIPPCVFFNLLCSRLCSSTTKSVIDTHRHYTFVQVKTVYLLLVHVIPSCSMTQTLFYDFGFEKRKQVIYCNII